MTLKPNFEKKKKTRDPTSYPVGHSYSTVAISHMLIQLITLHKVEVNAPVDSSSRCQYSS